MNALNSRNCLQNQIFHLASIFCIFVSSFADFKEKKLGESKHVVDSFTGLSPCPEILAYCLLDIEPSSKMKTSRKALYQS